MTSFTKCGKCIACTRFNGRNGSGYQPCHRPIPPEVEAPPITIDGPEITLYGSASNDRPSWYLIWLFGLLTGMSIGLLIAKSL